MTSGWRWSVSKSSCRRCWRKSLLSLSRTSGPGNAGTRLVEPFPDAYVQFELYYDQA